MNCRTWFLLVACGVSLLATACNEPVVFEPEDNSGNNGGSDNNDDADVGQEDASNNGQDNNGQGNNGQNNGDTPDMGGPEDMGSNNGGGPVRVFEPDFALFRDTVMPNLIREGCNNGGCHGSPLGFNAEMALVGGGDPSEEEIRENMDSVVDWVDSDAPSQSLVLRYMTQESDCCSGHPTVYAEDGITWRSVHDWIEASITLVEPDPPDMGDPDMPGEDMGGPDMDGEPDMPVVPCDALPQDPDRLPGGFDYDNFNTYVNPMMVRNCTLVGGCHASRGDSGGLFLLRDLEDACAVNWNFLTVRWFVDQANPIASPLLTEPLGVQSLGDYHGGEMVFNGNSDCDYVMLKSWIEDSFEVYLEFSGCVQ